MSVTNFSISLTLSLSY